MWEKIIGSVGYTGAKLAHLFSVERVNRKDSEEKIKQTADILTKKPVGVCISFFFLGLQSRLPSDAIVTKTDTT